MNNFSEIQGVTPKSAASELLNIWRENGVSIPDFNFIETKPKPIEKNPQTTPQLPKAKFVQPIDGQIAAKELAAKAQNLDELKQILTDFEGCNLKNTANQMVFCDGQKDADIMLIGEAPGVEEDKEGRPFVGKAGQLLDEMLLSIGLDRNKNFYLTNSVNWRPPGNRTPTRDEVAICMPFLKRHIFLKKPKLIVLIGGVAANAVLGVNEGITQLRRKPHSIEVENLGNIPVHCIFHPSYLLRVPTQKSLAWKDLLTIEAQIIQLGIKI